MRIARLAVEGGGFYGVGIVAEADASYWVRGDDMCRFIPNGESTAR